jgi:hypothetical protein
MLLVLVIDFIQEKDSKELNLTDNIIILFLYNFARLLSLKLSEITCKQMWKKNIKKWKKDLKPL